MTSIAFDGVTLATDSRTTNGGIITLDTPEPKFFFEGGRLFVWCGSECWAPELARHLKTGRAKKSEYPIRSAEEGTEAAVFDGVTWRKYYSVFPAPDSIRGKFAMGSGMPFCSAALLLGHNAVEAVRVATQLDPASGGPIFSVNVSEFFATKGDPLLITRHNA